MRRQPQRPLSFYDHHRQRYADKVPIPDAGEFLIGDYNHDGTVAADGEFHVALIDMNVNRRWGLYPRLKAFGDGVGALRRAIDAGLLDALEEGPVDTPDAFARRLLGLGFVDLSDRPLPTKVTDDRRRVVGAMRSGEWLRTQWIARVAFDLGAAKWTPEYGRRALGVLRQLHGEGVVERRELKELKRGNVGGVYLAFQVPRDEWRLRCTRTRAT